VNRWRPSSVTLGPARDGAGSPVAPISSDGLAPRSFAMLYTIAVVLLILWVLGLVSGYTIGAFIHTLLVIAVVLFLVGLVSGRRLV